MLRIINYDKLISDFAEEIACRQNEADYWYYIRQDQEMSSWILDTLIGVIDTAKRLGVFEESYQLALEMYDFSMSGREGYFPDLNHIQQMYDYFDSRLSQLVF